MAVVIEKSTTAEQRSVVSLLWTKGLYVKDIHKEMFPVYGGKCLSLIAVHNWVEKRGKYFADDEKFETEVRKWLRQQSNISMLQVSMHRKSDGTSVSMLVEDMSRNKCFFQVRISHVLRFVSICDLLTDSHSYTRT
jgi:hypothetical protein